MTLEEMKKDIDYYTSDDFEEEDIVGVFFHRYRIGEISYDEFKTAIGLVNFTVTEDFDAKTEAERKESMVLHFSMSNRTVDGHR